MEINETPKAGENHPIVLRFITSLFSGPYLSFGLLGFLALVVLTDYAYVLIREPKIYWIDYSREALNAVGGYEFGPLFALGFYLIYIALVWAVLRILNRKISIILWSAAVILHSSTFIKVSPICGSGTPQTFPYWLLCQYDFIIVPLTIGAILGIILSRTFFQGERRDGEDLGRGSFLAKLGVSRLGAALSVLWLMTLGVSVGLASYIPAQGWRPLIAESSPSPRYESMAAYDTERNKAVLFGGTIETSAGNWTKVDDTWEWDGREWTQLALGPQAIAPPARSGGAMAYDPKRKVILLFGGSDNLGKRLNDTWIWDGSVWKEVNNCDTCVRPPARCCHTLFYDTAREEVIVYGGCNDYQTYYNDAWGWNGSTWEYINVQDSPIASGAPIVYDPTNQQAVGFLAWHPSGTWIWDKNGWTKPSLVSLILEPPLRGNSMMANDPATGKSLLFGGIKTENNLTTFFEDTWVFDGKSWSEVESSLSPPGRWGHVIFFDTQLNRFILFGGFDGRSALNDLWEIEPSTNQEN
ncbi:MAG TPA: kelch repeat-containing protein [Anaerolineales bacterium]|nr:kelch repeat-containing protein [Anaerolineales bacterium]